MSDLPLKIFMEAQKQIEQDAPCLLATLVHTRGSTPQKPGAKMLIRSDGTFIGTLGGGCLEGDVWYTAKEMLKHRQGPQCRTYKLNEELAAQDGLVCGGTAWIYLHPVYTRNDFRALAPVLEALQGESAVTIATVVESPQPEQVGKQLFIYEDGSFTGEKIDFPEAERLIKIGKKLAAFGEHQFIAAESGEKIYLEGVTTPPLLVILGGGHVGKAVSELAARLGFRIRIIDDREEFANPERFPEAEQTIARSFHGSLRDSQLNSNSYVLIATRGHKFDHVAVEEALSTSARYIGLLGSKRKTILIYKDLLEKGFTAEDLARIHGPVGLNIGALTPEELAVSIVSEIIAVRRGGEGGPMRISAKDLERLV